MFGFLFRKIFGSKNERYLRKLRPVIARINALEPEMEALADEDFAARMAQYRADLAEGKTTLDELLPTAEKYGKHHIAIAGVVAGMALMGISLLIL